jgi:DNA-binding protein YbaB
MFDSIKGMAGLAGLMKDLPRIKARVEAIKAELAETTVEASAGGGAIVVVADGRMRIRSITIDPVVLATLANCDEAEHKGLAEELMAGAVNEALEKAQAMIGARFAAVAQELNLPIPAGGLAGLLGA